MADIDRGKLVRKQQQRATAMTDADEVRHLALYSNGDAAFMLLQLFRAEHDARCRRGETFVINIEGMVAKRSLGRWSASKYRKARETLLSLGLIKCVKAAAFRSAAEYLLGDRILTSSVGSANLTTVARIGIAMSNMGLAKTERDLAYQCHDEQERA